MEGSGYPVNAEHLFLKEKALVRVQQYFHAMELQIFLLSKKRGGKGLLKAFKNNKNCLISTLLQVHQQHKPYYPEPSSVQGFQC